MNCVIVDDEYRGRELLATLLKTHCPELTVAAMADSVSGGYEVIRTVEPELVFLDIEMHDGTGFDLLQKFDIPYFKTIFVTSYDQYAIQAVRFHAYDYLLKPVIINELKDAVKRLVEENKLKPSEWRICSPINCRRCKRQAGGEESGNRSSFNGIPRA